MFAEPFTQTSNVASLRSARLRRGSTKGVKPGWRVKSVRGKAVTPDTSSSVANPAFRRATQCITSANCAGNPQVPIVFRKPSAPVVVGSVLQRDANAPARPKGWSDEERARKLTIAATKVRHAARTVPFGDGSVLREVDRTIALGYVYDQDDEHAHTIRQAFLAGGVVDSVGRLPVRKSNDVPGLAAE
eukprot:gene31830-41911_t